MDFEKAVSLVGTVTDLRRIASAHVIDHNQLKDDELRSALCKSKPQYAASETVQKALEALLTREPKDSLRALAWTPRLSEPETKQTARNSGCL